MGEVMLSLWRMETIPNPATRPTMMSITMRVAEKYGVTVADIRGPSQTRRLVYPRWEAMHEIRQATTYSLPQIGRWFGGRDHSTVWNAVRKHDARIAAGLVD